ncbi:hypothetical protein WJX77_006357 [Trebouxia sp. C0004]
MESPKADVLLERLREYVKEQGGELAPGWHVEVKTRNSGTSAGTSDAYYFNPAGQRFRSRQEIMRHLELAAQQSKKVTREAAVANAKATAEQLGKQLPISLDNGVTVVRLGRIDDRPNYHSQTQLWPMGYQATWQDAAAGTFHCDILDGGGEGPLFAVSLVPPQAEQPAHSLTRARDIDTVWAELSDIQQAGLDAALASKSKSRKNKPAQAAPGPAASQADASAHGPHPEANGVAEVSSGLPNQDTASEADAAHGPGEGSNVDANGHLASEETQAANRQMPSGTSSISKSQKSDTAPQEATASDTGDRANGNHPEADEETSAEAEQVNEATVAKRQLLVKAAPLAGIWGLERFGLADVTVLKLMEALPGVEEHCTDYQYVEQRQGWDAEQRRLKKELEKHDKQAAKASRGLEKKGAKLLSLEASAQAKATQAEARLEAKAAAKRKRQEEKQAEKAQLKRAKKEQSQSKEPADKGPAQPEADAAAKAAKAPSSAEPKPKQRRKSGMDKSEKDIQHVLYKVIGQVERAYKREQEKAAAKAEKDAAKAQRHREREEQRQAKHASADHSKPKKESAFEAAAQQAAVAVLATDVEDSQLPGAAMQPPAADPVGKGLLTPQQISGVIEIREFMARFVDQVPHLDDLEAAFADPTHSQQHMQLLTELHEPLLELVVAEAFEAAIDVAGQENLDIRLHEMRYAMPPCNKGDSWPEVVRRYFALAATAALVKSTEASGGLDTALGALVGATPLSFLGPFAVLQSLTAGAHTGEPSEAGAARLPLGASKTAPEASQVKQDAVALAAAEQMLAACGGAAVPTDAEQKQAIITCRRMLLELASIKGPKIEGGHASARSLSFDGQSAAAAAKSGVPIDLITVAARVDAGVYSCSNGGIDAFAADVQSVCDLFRAASRRSNSTFAGELNTKNASAMADLVSFSMDKLLSQHHGLAVPDQAPTPGKKLKKGSSAESSPGMSSEPGSSNENNVNIVEDLARPFAPWEGCCVCWEDEDRKHILLCDKCDAEYHTYCLDPPLEDVPEGEWFCPRCKSELDLDSSNEPMHSSLVPTRLMKQEDCYRSLAAALRQQEYHELTAGQRVQIAVLLCSLATLAAVTRSQLTDAEDSKKEMRKEQLALKAKLKREEKERAAAAAADAAEAQSAPAAEGKEAAEKAAKKLEGNARTRAKQEADAAADLQRDLARIEELTVEIRKCSLRRDMLGFDRHWNRYWLLEGSCPEAVTSDDTPAPAWVYVERCVAPPGQGQGHLRGSSNSEDEELPLGQLAQRDDPERQHAKRRKVQMPDDQGEAHSWGCYKTADHLGKLITFLNYRGIREGQLQKALQKVRPKLPSAASLAAATAAAEAAKQKALQRALFKPSSVSLATSAQIEEDSHQPFATIQAEAAPAGAASSAPEDMAATAPAGPSVAALGPASALTGPSPMDVDAAQDASSAQVSGLQPESPRLTADDPPDVAKSEEGQKAETSKHATEPLPASELGRCRGEIGAFASGLAPEAYDSVKGSEARQQQWQLLVATAMRSQELMAATLLLENMLRNDRFRPHWRICNMPAPSPSSTGSLAAVKLRLHALKAAVKKTVGAAAAVAAVTREVGGYAHAGGGYSFRQRKAAGTLAEPSAEDSAEEESAAVKPPRAGVKRTRSTVRHADEEVGLDDDEALARRLQEQEDALATRGRATRGALKVTLKPKLAAQKGPIRGSGSRAVRSSSRLKPQAAEAKEGPTTRVRGSAGMRTTCSRAQTETYSSSSEDEAEGASGSGNSDPSDSSPASSVAKVDGSNSGEAGDDKNPMLADSESDHGSAAQEKQVKRSKDRASESRHSSRDSSLARSTRAVKPVVETKAVEGRKRLRKAS